MKWDIPILSNPILSSTAGALSIQSYQLKEKDESYLVFSL